MNENCLLFTGSKLGVFLSKESPAWKYHGKISSIWCYMQDEPKNQCKHWKNQDNDRAIWFSNNFWMIGDAKDVGSDACVIKAPGSNDQWPTDLNGNWLYWNPDSKEWIKAEIYIKVVFLQESLPYNRHCIV